MGEWYQCQTEGGQFLLTILICHLLMRRLAFPLKLLEDFQCKLLDADLWSFTWTEWHPTFLTCLTVNSISYWKKNAN